jgi:hypothetical protein
MKKVNKSMYYILPLIRGWSALAEPPINTFARGGHKNSLILQYPKGSIPMGGEKIAEDEDNQYFQCPIDREYLEDYSLLINGEYSKIKDDTKNLLISRASALADSRRIEKVLYKSKRLRKHLEDTLGINDLDAIAGEYDSKMYNEEFLKINYDKSQESVEI